MDENKSVVGWLESHDNPVKEVARRVRDTILHADERIKEAIKGDARTEKKSAAKKKTASRKRAARPAAKKARSRKKAARPAAKKAARKKTSARGGTKKARKRAGRRS